MVQPSLVVKSRDDLSVPFFYLHHLSAYTRELNLQEIKGLPRGFTRKQLKREMKQALRRSIKQYYWVSCNAPKRIGMKGRCVVYRVNMPFMCSEEAARKYLKRTFVGDALQHIEYVAVKRLQYIQRSNDLLLFSNYVAYLHVPIECVEAFTTSCNNSMCAALDRKD